MVRLPLPTPSVCEDVAAVEQTSTPKPELALPRDRQVAGAAGGQGVVGAEDARAVAAAQRWCCPPTMEPLPLVSDAAAALSTMNALALATLARMDVAWLAWRRW
jgi:hypothetical protein